MGGFFGVTSKNDCVFDLFYGTDYHSHLGTRRAGMAVHDKVKGFDRAIHNIETSNFRPKFDKDILKMEGQLRTPAADRPVPSGHLCDHDGR